MSCVGWLDWVGGWVGGVGGKGGGAVLARSATSVMLHLATNRLHHVVCRGPTLQTKLCISIAGVSVRMLLPFAIARSRSCLQRGGVWAISQMSPAACWRRAADPPSPPPSLLLSALPGWSSQVLPPALLLGE
jgi:hypothetical protein